MEALLGFAYLCETILLDPWDDSKRDCECKRILECRQTRHRLARHWSIAIHYIRQADRLHGTQNSVRDAGTGERDGPVEVVPQTGSPHHQADGAESEGENLAPEAELGLEVTAAALRDPRDEPIANKAAIETADYSANEVL